MRRIILAISAIIVAAIIGVAAVWAASGGHGHASQVTYEASETASTVKFTGDVSFEYSGYRFTSASAELVIDKPDPSSPEANLRRGDFSGGVNITTPSGGKLSSPQISMKKISGEYEFTGTMTYSEGELLANAGRFLFDSSNEIITATGGVTAVYSGLRGLRKDDKTKHQLTYTSDGFTYHRQDGLLKNAGEERPKMEFDGLTVTAGELSVTLSEDGVIAMGAAGDIKVSGEGISFSGLNASYSADTGEMKVWGDVHYTRSGDEFQAEEAVWHLGEGGNRITVTGGQGTVGVGRENSKSGDGQGNN
jgi:hypothetical protein